MRDNVAGVVADPLQPDRTQSLARGLGLAYLTTRPEQGLVLVFKNSRLELQDAANPRRRALCVDFHSAAVKKRLQAGLRGNLARACGLHRRRGQSVFDATCGLARDSAVLMGLGCNVLAGERQPVVRALLEDGVARAGPLPRWQGLISEDASCWLTREAPPVADIIYLDPMFGGDRNALPKWELQALHRLAGDDRDAGALFEAARRKAGRRVVVKRHPKAAPLASPDRQLRGKRARFDIYLTGDSDFR